MNRYWVLAAVSLHLGLQGKAQPTPCFPPCETLNRDQLSHTVPGPQTHEKCEMDSGRCLKLVGLWRLASAAMGHSHRWALESSQIGSAPASATCARSTSQASSFLCETRHTCHGTLGGFNEKSHRTPAQDAACR